jgi:hypothetical protein
MDSSRTHDRVNDGSIVELAILQGPNTRDSQTMQQPVEPSQERRSSTGPFGEWLRNQRESLDDVSEFPRGRQHGQHEVTDVSSNNNNQSHATNASYDRSRESSPWRSTVQEEQPLQPVYQANPPTSIALEPVQSPTPSHGSSVALTIVRAALDLCIALTPLYFLTFAVLAFAYRGTSVTTSVNSTLLRAAGYVCFPKYVSSSEALTMR